MKFRLAVVLAAIALAAHLAATGRFSQPIAAGAQTVPVQAGPSLSIVAPRNGDRLAQSFVRVEYRVTNPAASGWLNFQLQLDDRDPVTTTATEYNFTGLAPGSHTVTVTLVDANKTPIMGAQAQVQFAIVQPPRSQSPRGVPPVELRPAAQQEVLPASSSSLPLLAVIGLGVLAGGIISARRTR